MSGRHCGAPAEPDSHANEDLHDEFDDRCRPVRQRPRGAAHRGSGAAGRAGRFTDDVDRRRPDHLAFLRSPYAHARIVSIDCRRARAMPGVLAVYTGAELAAAGVKPIPSIDVFKRADGKALVTPARRALAHERVRFVGEAVAAVVAETRDAARDACEAIMVDFDELPAVVDAVAATTPGAAVIDPDAPDNIAAEMRHGNAAATATAFAGAPMSSRSTSSTSASRRARSSRAACSPSSTRRAAG
jgi:CO/xanthine dehydrogenase Mo-binding subunit